MNNRVANHPISGLMQRISAAWDHYWFLPTPESNVRLVRMAICLVTAAWFLSFWSSLTLWFGETGVMNATLATKLIEFEGGATWQHWSPLWMLDSVWACRIWLGLGLLVSFVAAVGIGGRLSIGLLLLLVIAWTHRIVWLQGAIEPALISSLGYLFIAGGTFTSQRLLGLGEWIGGSKWEGNNPLHWSNTAALRLIRIHVWLLIAFGLASQLGSLVWWRGEAAWWLAAEGKSQFVGVEMLRGSPALVNGLTHGFVLLQALTLWLLTMPLTRYIGLCAGLLLCVMTGLLSGQVLYACLLAAALLAYWPALDAASEEQSVASQRG